MVLEVFTSLIEAFLTDWLFLLIILWAVKWVFTAWYSLVLNLIFKFWK